MSSHPTGLHRRGGVPYVDDASIESILAAAPTPVIAYSAATLRANVAAARAAFGPTVRLQYSYKACYLPAVLRVLHAAGLDAEVCSARECRLALAVGMPPERISWNAVALAPDDLRLALDVGVQSLGLNTIDDVRRVASAAAAAGLRLDVALRVHPEDVSSTYLEAGSRLGLDVADGTARRAVETVLASPGLRLVGLHSHTQVRQPEPAEHDQVLRSTLRFAADVAAATGYRIGEVGLGGGLACRAEMRAAGTDVDAFGVLARSHAELAPDVTLVLEPGRFFVSDAACGVATVVSATAARGRRWLVVDLGTQVLVPFEGRRFPVEAAEQRPGPRVPTSVGDRLSSYSGVLDTDVELPELRAGDRLLVTEIGAYTTSVAQRFMFGAPAVVLVDGEHVRRIATAEDDGEWVDSLLARDAL